MNALAYSGFWKKPAEDRLTQQFPGPTDTVVKNLKTTIRGPDRHLLRGDVTPRMPGRIPGHERRGKPIKGAHIAYARIPHVDTNLVQKAHAVQNHPYSEPLRQSPAMHVDWVSVAAWLISAAFTAAFWFGVVHAVRLLYL
jgi:hypothetical protein